MNINLVEYYDDLCAKRDAINEKIAPLKAKLEDANAREQAARAEAMAIAAEISEIRGGRTYLDLKTEIQSLAVVASKLRKKQAAAAE